MSARSEGHRRTGDGAQWQRADGSPGPRPIRYSPVQDRVGVVDPADDELPPVAVRVNQHPSPYSPAWLDEREILRVTYQGDDRCNLRCPGCYTGERLDRPSIAPAAANERLRVPWEDFTGHLRGLGPGLQDFYLLGAEPTMDPEGSAAKLAYAAEVGLTTMSITNGVSSRPGSTGRSAALSSRRPLQGDRQPRLDRPRGERRAARQHRGVPQDDRHDRAGRRDGARRSRCRSLCGRAIT